MKRIAAFALFMALCLCAAPVSAQENANNHPGGPFLYPIVKQADDGKIDLPHLYSGDTATPPPAPYTHLWNSFYDGGADINWDRAYAGIPEEWGDFKSAYPDRNAVFSLYRTELSISDLSAQLSGGARLMDLAQLECPNNISPLAEMSAVQGVVLNRKENGVPMGHARIYRIDRSDLPPADDQYFTVDNLVSFEEMREGRYFRDSSMAVLLWNDSLKAQLDASGLDLPNTTARSVIIPDYTDGVLFSDGNREYFLPQQKPDLTHARENYEPLGPKPEGAYYLAASYPILSCSLEQGRLYPLSDLAADLKRVAGGGFVGKWEPGDKAPALNAKPVIYLYPEKETDVSVKLQYKGIFTFTYPAYGDGWNVTAYPDGRIVNKADGSEHYYLFWEGVSDTDWTFDQGFCVKGADTEAFLRDKLPLLGLTPREYNDFITYWAPKMQGNPYNLIKFADTEYENLAPLTVTPKPDAVARIHMVYRPLEKPVKIPPQTLSGFHRKGFTVVEWGGTEAGTTSRTK